MKLGFVSAILPELSVEEVIEFAAETDYECVELMCWPVSKAERRYAGVTHVDAADLDVARGGQWMRRAEQLGVEISGLGYYPNPLAPDPDESARCVGHLRKVIAAAAALRIPRVHSFVGRDWTRSIEDNWPRFLETWRPLVAEAEQARVRIGIENCPMRFSGDEWPGGKNLAVSPAIWRRMFTDIPSPWFGLNYDPSHFVWQRMDYLKPLREFTSRLFHIHAKDVRIDPHRLDDVGILAHPLEYHVPKLPGLGDIDWGRFFSVLADVGYRGPVCVEVEDRSFEENLAARKASLVQSARYLRNFLTRR
ncbi:MAG: sugar phosphate isomerase/epimerase [Planctomycetes bacterium]|nr:sugar phosphate isomerase/epimerase [Planctomycetota bacterium]